MIYLKSTLAGLGGSILALILLIAVIVILNILKVSKNGMVGIGIFGPLPLGVVILGFVLGFYLVFRNSS
jgi:hypothetical protein